MSSLNAVDVYFRAEGERQVRQTLVSVGADIQTGDPMAEAHLTAATAEIVDGYSEQVVRLVREQRFRHRSGLAQQAALRAIARQAADESGIEQLYVTIAFYESAAQELAECPTQSPRRLYVVDALRTSAVERRTDIPEMLGGLCRGLLCLEELHLPDRPVRSDADLLDPTAGLCLSLEPDRQTAAALLLAGSQAIHVPVSGQAFDAIFV